MALERGLYLLIHQVENLRDHRIACKILNKLIKHSDSPIQSMGDLVRESGKKRNRSQGKDLGGLISVYNF